MNDSSETLKAISAHRPVKWLLISCALLCLLIMTLRIANTSVIPVFVDGRLLTVHLFAALPMAAMVRTSFLESHFKVPTWRALLAVLSLVSVYALPQISALLSTLDAGPGLRILPRILLCLLLVCTFLPDACSQLTRTSHSQWIVAGVLLAYPAWIFASYREHRNLDELSKSLLEMRLDRSELLAEQLQELGSVATIRGLTVAELSLRLSEQRLKIENTLEQSIPAQTSSQQLIQRSMLAMQVGKLDEAQATLNRVTEPNSESRLLQATLAREKKQWSQLEELTHELIREWHQPSETIATDQFAMAYQLHADALVHQNRLLDAQQVLEEGIISCPNHQAELQLQLAGIFTELGDKRSALKHLNLAAQYNPSLQPEVLRKIRAIDNFTCSLWARQ